MNNELSERVLSLKEAAAFVGVCKTTLGRMNIPRVKIRRKVLYQKSVLLRWLEENTSLKEARQ